MQLLLKGENVDPDVESALPHLAEMAEGYSGSDLKELCRAAAMEPIRELVKETSRRAVMGEGHVEPPDGASARPMSRNDFVVAMSKVKRTGQDAHAYGIEEQQDQWR